MEAGFVVDNSVVMAWCFKDQANAYADSVLERLADTVAYVPSVWPLEVVNVLLAAERKRSMSQANSVRFISLVSELPIIVENDNFEKTMKELLGLARAHDLSSYDASYLELAMRKGLPLATLDDKLRKAAAHASVPILFIRLP
ncbi:MAG: DNA-binding protein [Candidatus Aminicenantes bacterium RBG_13_62_12]|jgi:predicted nucleic acid-binding protein|nr:MAG: DNA-binding protein [Candidatus Aminicenantes bacterium RBG_13_62_12]